MERQCVWPKAQNRVDKQTIERKQKPICSACSDVCVCARRVRWQYTYIYKWHMKTWSANSNWVIQLTLAKHTIQHDKRYIYIYMRSVYRDICTFPLEQAHSSATMPAKVTHNTQRSHRWWCRIFERKAEQNAHQNIGSIHITRRVYYSMLWREKPQKKKKKKKMMMQKKNETSLAK